MTTKNAQCRIFVLCLFLALSACHKSSSDSNSTDIGSTTTGTTSSLTVANKVSVVDAKLSGSVAAAKPLRIGLFKVTAADFGATSDYNKDQTHFYVDERSADSLNTVNSILCSMAQTKYDDMLNKGNYIALVDKNVCDNASSAGQQSQNQSSGANMPNYQNFTVNSSRLDNSSPEIVKVWVDDPNMDTPDGTRPGRIYVNAVVTESTSTTNPYGIFTLNLAGYPIVNGTQAASPFFKGTLEAVRSDPTNSTSKVQLKFIMNATWSNSPCGAGSQTQAVALDRLPDGSAGAGKISNNESSASTQPGCSSAYDFNIAYNSSDFVRTTPTTGQEFCLSRTNYEESAWSYGLYDATGARVARNSGFPISYTDPATSSKYQGWIGYWGLWVNDSSVQIPDGATVNKVDYNSGTQTSTPYTMVERGGKLKKHTRTAMTLNDIKNVPLSYWDQGKNYQVVYGDLASTGTASFFITASMPSNCGNNCTWSSIKPAQLLDLANLNWNELNFWSDSLNGQVRVKFVDANNNSLCTYDANNRTYNCSAALSSALPVVAYLEDLVYPGDLGASTVTLACFNNCLDPVAGFATLTDNNTSNDDPGFQTAIVTKTITTTSDWTGINPLVTDPQGDFQAYVWTHPTATGDNDIKAMYVAKDASYLYVRMDLYGPANTHYQNGPSSPPSPNYPGIEGRYEVEIQSNSTTYPELMLGIAYSTGNCGGWALGCDGSNSRAPASLTYNSGSYIPSNLRVSTDANGHGIIEIKVPLADIGNPTAFYRISGDVNNCCASPMITIDYADNSRHDYTIDPSAMVLKSVERNADVVLTGTINSQQYQWGVQSGALFEPTSTNLAALACDWDKSEICGWKADSALPVFYTWETGPNNWNRFTALKDANSAFVKFDPPLQVKYVGSGDPFGANGTTYMLQYAGFGQLDGIPGKCVNLDTGADADCSQSSQSIRWVPQFIIPPLTNGFLTKVTDNKGADYYVKPLEIEQRMKADLNMSNCSALASTDFSVYTLPDIGIWSDPVAAIGSEPTVTASPAAIGGVIQ